jgi:hypothetical protein
MLCSLSVAEHIGRRDAHFLNRRTALPNVLLIIAGAHKNRCRTALFSIFSENDNTSLRNFRQR